MVKKPCIVCGQLGQKLKCVGCNTPYCSSTCHKSDRTHTKLCKKIMRLKQENAKINERNRYYFWGLAIAFTGTTMGLFGNYVFNISHKTGWLYKQYSFPTNRDADFPEKKKRKRNPQNVLLLTRLVYNLLPKKLSAPPQSSVPWNKGKDDHITRHMIYK